MQYRNDIQQKLLKLESLYFKRIQIVGTNVKIQITLSLLCVMLLAGCKAPPAPITDNTIVSSSVNGGIKLSPCNYPTATIYSIESRVSCPIC